MRVKGLAALVAVLLGAGGLPAQAAPATVSGTVHDEHGQPVERACIFAFTSTSDTFRGASAETEADGTFSFMILTPGKRYVYVSDCWAFQSPRFVGEWWRDGEDAPPASPVAVGPLEEPHLAFVVGPGAIVTGHLSGPDGEPASDVCVYALPDRSQYRIGLPSPWDFEDTSDESGAYEIRGLMPGDIRLSFQNCAYGGQTGWMSTYFGADGYRWADATVVTLDDGPNIVDATLVRAGGISGDLTRTDGSPATGACVTATNVGTDESWASEDYYYNQVSHYRIQGLRPGRYVVRTTDCGAGWDVTYHPAAVDPADATIVEVRAAQWTTDVDIVTTRCQRPVDSDEDGLDDCAERVAHTRVDDPDSDQDGLTDGAEVHTHRTDPVRRDTDGDGFKDGSEINGTCAGQPLQPSDPNDPTSTPLTGGGLGAPRVPVLPFRPETVC